MPTCGRVRRRRHDPHRRPRCRAGGAGVRISTVDFWGHAPPEANEGPYKIGAIIMVSRDSIAEGYRLTGLPQWFPAHVCYPEADNTYRWYDPFIHYETDGPIHDDSYGPVNKSCVGK